MPTRRRAHDDDPASAATELKLFLETKLQPDDYADAEKLIDAMSGAEDEETGLPRPGGAQDHRFAMDSADPFRRMRDLQAAEREVAPYVGDDARHGQRQPRCFARHWRGVAFPRAIFRRARCRSCGASPSAPAKVPAAARHVPRMTPAPLPPSTRSSRA